MRSVERRKLNVLEMKCLRSLAGVSRMDRVSNEEVCRSKVYETWVRYTYLSYSHL